ncbi:hypothetical protein [Paenibacillus ehimensis]|uniref:hypothetical protein n=1 Tax=Paenibacillus ehimensis TaxID=79264 RepID=UPI000FD88C2D|nr:hypothetical protein [Paenibacillus ehimensis]
MIMLQLGGEQDIRDYFLGFDTRLHIEVYFRGQQTDDDKEYLLRMILESYHVRQHQKLNVGGRKH